MNKENINLTPEQIEENDKISRMYFYTALFSFFSIIYYKLFYKTDSIRFKNYLNAVTNYTITFLIIVIILSLTQVTSKTIESLGFFSLCYLAYAGGIIKSGKEFKFFFTIKFLKEE